MFIIQFITPMTGVAGFRPNHLLVIGGEEEGEKVSCSPLD